MRLDDELSDLLNVDHPAPDYTDLVEIGRGASSTVYRASSNTFARDVAIKVFHGTIDEPQLRRDFRRECGAVGVLADHPHVVSVFDSGFTSDRRPFLVMPYCDGGSFGQRLTALGPRPLEEVLAVGVALADALDAAHRNGILHRDVKPQNVLLTHYGVVALGDFGVAVRSPAELTSMAATPGYAAPEVILDHTNAGPPADIYGLGATLFALITGSAPFVCGPEESELQFLLRVVEEPCPLLPPHIPEPVAQVVSAMMAKEPTRRPESAAHAREMLRDAADRTGLTLPSRIQPVVLQQPTWAGAPAPILSSGPATPSGWPGLAGLLPGAAALLGGPRRAVVSAAVASLVLVGAGAGVATWLGLAEWTGSPAQTAATPSSGSGVRGLALPRETVIVTVTGPPIAIGTNGVPPALARPAATTSEGAGAGVVPGTVGVTAQPTLGPVVDDDSGAVEPTTAPTTQTTAPPAWSPPAATASVNARRPTRTPGSTKAPAEG